MDRILSSPLISNGYELSSEPNRLGWLSPSSPDEPIDLLREQYTEQGYLWLKGLIPRDDVLAFRQRYFAALRPMGLVAPDSDPVDGFFDPDAEVDTQALQALRVKIHRWAAFESFCLSEAIWKFYERFLGGPVYLHKRLIIRHTTPSQESTTGAHYDLTYLRAGTYNVYTSWIPLGDIPVEMGGLVYLEGSDTFGRENEAEYNKKNQDLPLEERISAYNKHMKGGWLTKDLPSLADRLDTRWLIADYEAGDMVIHSGFMIHAATRNMSRENRMRLSTDIRYQLVDEKIDSRWAKPWSPDDGL